MSKYTTEVRYICENAAGQTNSVGFSHVNDILTTAAPIIFDFDFPIYDEEYRLPLEIKILRHFYTREISEESVGLWKLRLQDKLNLIMPYYNKLYESAELDFNPFYDVDVNKTMVDTNNNSTDKTRTNNRSINDIASSEGTNSQNKIGSQTIEGTDWNLYSDTPQGGIQIFGEEEVSGGSLVQATVEGNSYLTNATKDTTNKAQNTSETIVNNSNVSSSDSKNDVTNEVGRNVFTSTENYVDHKWGKQGTTSYSKLLVEYRETLINIDLMIIEELSDLFFGLWE